MTPTPRDRAQAEKLILSYFVANTAEEMELLTERVATALAAREAEVREACATQIELTPASVFMGNEGDERAFISRDAAAATIRASAAPRETEK